MARQLHCYDCGKIFTPKGRTYYLKDKHKYICPSCARQRDLEVERLKREYNKATIGMGQSYFSMALKIIIGIACIAMAKGETITWGMGILIILWGIIPFIFRRRKR